MEDTLVAELETSTVEEEAPPSGVTEETASEPTAQETDASETETEDTITREEHERLLEEAKASLKADLERQAEDQRQEQALTANRQRIAQAQQVLGQAAGQKLLGIYQWMQNQIEDGKNIPWNPKVTQSIADEMAAAVITDQFARIHHTVQQTVGKLFAGHSVSPGSQRALEIAIANGDSERAIQVLVEQIAELTEAKKLPELVEKAAKQAADKSKAAQQTETTKTKDAAAKLGAPTRGISPTSKKVWSLAEVQAMPMNEWLAMPKEDRDRILREVKRG